MNEFLEKAEKLGMKIPHLTSDQINEQVKPVLRKMEKNGIRLDCKAIKELDEKLSAKLKELEKEISHLAGVDFNLGSPIQMAEVLFDRLKLPTDGLRKTKTGISTAASELHKIINEHPIIALIIEQRELSKLITTYLRPLPLLVDENDRLHTTYGLETTTGRLTSSEPNLQNIPIRGRFGSEIRRAFSSSAGYRLISADYSQIELRIVACLAKDQAMIDAFTKGIDIHTRTAAQIFNVKESEVTPEHRRVAKAVNFGIVYGQTPFGLSQALGIDTTEAAKYIGNYFDVHKGIKQYINDMIAMAHDCGYVETIFGMKRYLPEINSRVRYISESEERAAINTPVQGTAAELLKLAMIDIDKKLTIQYPDSRMLLNIHDELIVEAPEDQVEDVADLIKDTMEKVMILCVPIEAHVGIGDNWAEAK